MVDPGRAARIRAGTEGAPSRSRGRTDAAPRRRSYRRRVIDPGGRSPMSTRPSIRAGRLAAAAAIAAAVCFGAGPPAGAAPHPPLCVGGNAPCFSTIQAAVDAASPGDRIQVGPGTYAGGMTIDKSLELTGAGANATVIAGGGPVLTIGSFLGDNAITVGIDRVTITGGLNETQPSTSIVAGGGVWIPQSAGNAAGATVTIGHSVVTGNRVAASTTIPPGGFSCKGSPTPCAFVGGGGIDNSGALTLDHTDVTDNTAGSAPAGPGLESAAGGGGIATHPQGTLVLRHCRVDGNTASVSPPDGAFTDGGGISDDGALTVDQSSVDANSSIVVASVPSTFVFGDGDEANAGGIQITSGATATISHSTVDRNNASAFDGGGDAHASSGGIHNHGTLVLDHSSVSGNTAAAAVPAGSGFLAGVIGGGFQLGPDPSTTTIAFSRVDGNAARADSPGGAVTALGGGVANLDGTLTLDHADVGGNSGAANGASAWSVFGASLSALGGGVLNTTFGGSGPVLSAGHSTITGNAVATTTSAPARGGGVFTRDLVSGGPFAAMLDRTTVAGNTPDDCNGC
jgi:hypothetical protein